MFACSFVIVPTRSSIIQSYLMIEGSKIIKAENAEEFAKKLNDKVDHFLNRFYPDKKKK